MATTTAGGTVLVVWKMALKLSAYSRPIEVFSG
jgi:hypothetical protein